MSYFKELFKLTENPYERRKTIFSSAAEWSWVVQFILDMRTGNFNAAKDPMEFSGMLVQSVYCSVYVFDGRHMYENGRQDLCKKYINYSMKDEDEERIRCKRSRKKPSKQQSR